jgi:hypothetical protein
LEGLHASKETCLEFCRIHEPEQPPNGVMGGYAMG